VAVYKVQRTEIFIENHQGVRAKVQRTEIVSPSILLVSLINPCIYSDIDQCSILINKHVLVFGQLLISEVPTEGIVKQSEKFKSARIFIFRYRRLVIPLNCLWMNELDHLRPVFLRVNRRLYSCFMLLYQ